jgi:hypothetical protein
MGWFRSSNNSTGNRGRHLDSAIHYQDISQHLNDQMRTRLIRSGDVLLVER